MNRKWMMWMVLAILPACGGVQAPGDPVELTKRDAKALLSDPGQRDGAADICEEEGWIGDGVCDAWCPSGDEPDCGKSGVCTDDETKQADDGCNTCSCSGGEWACTEMACVPSEGSGGPQDGVLALEIGDCGAASDPLNIESVQVSGDKLLVGAGWGAGCAEHTFTACWDGAFLESYPVQARITIIHDANGETCKAYASETLEIDLEALKTAYQSGYQGQSGTIIVGVDGLSADYSF